MHHFVGEINSGTIMSISQDQFRNNYVNFKSHTYVQTFFCYTIICYTILLIFHQTVKLINTHKFLDKTAGNRPRSVPCSLNWESTIYHLRRHGSVRTWKFWILVIIIIRKRPCSVVVVILQNIPRASSVIRFAYFYMSPLLFTFQLLYLSSLSDICCVFEIRVNELLAWA